MVELNEHRTHQTYLAVTIRFQAPTKTLNPQEITTFYVKDQLSPAQIAKKVGCSKGYVISVLKRASALGQRRLPMTDPLNYRNAVPPFGYRVTDGKLTPHPGELKTCRLIVDLVDRRGFNYRGAAQELAQRGAKNRRGTTAWHNYTVSRIYERWRGKL